MPEVTASGVSELLAMALALLESFEQHHAGECRVDHDGACQAHFLEVDGCTVQATRVLLDTFGRPARAET